MAKVGDTFNVGFKVELDDETLDFLEFLENRIQVLEAKMATAEETLNQFVSDINDETNLLASRIDDLVAQVANGGPQGVTSEQLSAALGPISERLRGLGSDGTAVNTGDPTTDTDPTNSPTADSPQVNPAPDAPTDEPTPDPTVNPVDVPVDSLPGNDSSTVNDPTAGVTQTDTSIPQNAGSGVSSDTTTGASVTDTTSSENQPSNPPPSSNTNDFREEL